MARPKILHQSTYFDTPIHQGASGNRAEILAAIEQIFTSMWHSCNQRLCVGHLTVNIPADDDIRANDLMTGVLQSWHRTMSNRKIRSEYIWGREQGDMASGGHPHYHIFIILNGKYIQTVKGVCDSINRLLSRRLGREVHLAHINPPLHESGKVWAKKVSAKLDNLADAMQWVSYVSKCDTKSAPRGQRTYGFSKGFLKCQAGMAQEDEFQAENLFDEVDLTMSEAEWGLFGNVDWEEILDFDPLTGGSRKVLSTPLPCTEASATGVEAV